MVLATKSSKNSVFAAMQGKALCMINKEDLTEEQRKVLKKLYRKYQLNIATAVFLYVGFLFFTNFAVILMDSFYVHSAQFRFFMSFGGAVIAMSGLRGTVEEMREDFNTKVKEVSGHEK